MTTEQTPAADIEALIAEFRDGLEGWTASAWLVPTEQAVALLADRDAWKERAEKAESLAYATTSEDKQILWKHLWQEECDRVERLRSSIGERDAVRDAEARAEIAERNLAEAVEALMPFAASAAVWNRQEEGRLGGVTAEHIRRARAFVSKFAKGPDHD